MIWVVTTAWVDPGASDEDTGAEADFAALFELCGTDDCPAIVELDRVGIDFTDIRVGEVEAATEEDAEDAGNGIELAGVCVTGQTVV